VKRVSSIVAALVLAVAGSAGAGEPPRLAGASASSTVSGDSHTVWTLFDGDEASTWCAKEKVHVQLTLRLGRVTTLGTLHLSLGDSKAWARTPRIKQVFVTVKDGEKTMKKIRHKWPDHDGPKVGLVNLGAPGDSVVIDIDQVYAGSGTGGLCIPELTLEHAEGTPGPVDTAGAMAALWSHDSTRKALIGRYDVIRGGARGRIEINKRGTFTYSDAEIGLALEGKWELQDPTDDAGTVLRVKLRKMKIKGQKQAVPPQLESHTIPWVLDTAASTPAFLPWASYTIDESGAVVLVPPDDVVAAP
jgi:hypothetical protein